jgi:excisionase family DNA binding protein
MMILRTSEAAGYIGLRKSTLEAWRVRGGGPVFLKLGKAVRYRKDDLDAFLNGCECRNTTEGARKRTDLEF